MTESLNYRLTPADIQDLRGSVRWQLSVELTGNPSAVPVIRFDKRDRFFYLHTEGHVRCRHQRIEVLGAVLALETALPGWTLQALDTRLTCEEVLQSADERARLAAAKAAHAEAEAKTRAELARRTDLQNLTLDDLM